MRQLPSNENLFLHQKGLQHHLTPAYQQAVVIVISCMFLGLGYALLWDSHETIVPLINGIVIGLSCGVSIAWSELFLFKSIGRKWSFIALVSTKVIAYVLILSLSIFTVILISRSIEYGQDPITTFYGQRFQHLLFHEDFHIMVLYAVVMASVIIFTKEMSRKMGQGVLFNFITGKYQKPFREERIFMFLDLDASSSLAEKLGDLQYHQLLNEFYFDITEDIIEARGEIYQYVGDEVVVTWKMKRGLPAGNCLRAYFNILHKIESVKDKYTNRFGTLPRFKAAFHCGEVITAQVGDVKTEIVFHGDVVNTTSRIEHLCSELGERLLISKDLLDKLPLSFVDFFKPVGKVRPRGKERHVELFGLKESEKPSNELSELKLQNPLTS